MKLLLHACCGPCSLEPVRLLYEEGHQLSIAYMNSNIHPEAEYLQRKNTLLVWAQSQNLAVIEGIYAPQLWQKAISAQAACSSFPRKERCRLCYRFRFEETAAYAKTHNFDGICTTLSVSPYQFVDLIAEELQAAANSHGLKFVFHDFRPYYSEATRRSKDLGMYRQNYCGCCFSKTEAQAEREERKLQRKRAKQERKKSQDYSEPKEDDIPL